MSSPRVVIGALLFNHARELREALDSLLFQSFRDFALVLVDDGSTDGTEEIARAYAAMDARVSYVRNTERLGLIGNSRRAFELACERHPDAEYFAWASDHDLWHPRWLERLVAALEEHPDVVLAYPLNRRISAEGNVVPTKRPWMFDTAGVTDRWSRMRRSIRGMSAGNMVYGLFRVNALRRAGIYRHVLVPDRLLFTELSLYGQFEQVQQVLWFRRSYGKLFSLGRQRLSFFPGRRPLYAYAPWWIAHAVSLFWTLAIRGVGRPEISRAAGAWIALQCFLRSGLLHVWQRFREWRTVILDRSPVIRQYDARFRLRLRAVSKRVGNRLEHIRQRTRYLTRELIHHPHVLAAKAVRRLFTPDADARRS